MANRPEKPKDLQPLRGKFVERFPVAPLEWGLMRDWLKVTYPGESLLTKRNGFDSLRDFLDYAVDVGKLPLNLVARNGDAPVDNGRSWWR